MTWRHIAALGLAVLILLLAGTVVFVCGLHPACAQAGAFGQVVTMAMALVTTSGSIITGVFALIHGDGRASARKHGKRRKPR